MNTFDGVSPASVAPAAQRTQEAKQYSGFIAQEVEAAARAVHYDFSGVSKPVGEHGKYTLAYGEFVVPLVKAVQEQQKEIDGLKDELGGIQPVALSSRAQLFAWMFGDAGALGLVGAFLALLFVKKPKKREDDRATCFN